MPNPCCISTPAPRSGRRPSRSRAPPVGAPRAEPLARYTGARASLLATESGDNPFDEACSQTWWQLEAHFRGRHPIPMACMSVTLELRGAADVSHALASADADALIAFLTHRGIVEREAPPMAP